MLVVFVAAMLAGVGSLLAPYSAYGRIASNLLAPVYAWGNNLLAYIAGRMDSYAFYSVDVWMKSLSTLLVAVVTFAVLFVLAWRSGRTYCNTICPVGTVLGFLARYSLFKPRFDTSKCNGCKLCARNGKASCIDPAAHKIDYSRCVACMDCLENCGQGPSPIRCGGGNRTRAPAPQRPAGRRRKDAFRRFAPPVPRPGGHRGLLCAPGAGEEGRRRAGGDRRQEDSEPCHARRSARSAEPAALQRPLHGMPVVCFGVSQSGVASVGQADDPHAARNVVRARILPSGVHEVRRGVPHGAIRLTDLAGKSSIQIGHAVWIAENCVVNTDGVSCNNCARHCPAGAIKMVRRDPDDPKSPRIPAVNEERCIGCGACENLCPARPFSAIYVEGHSRHRIV